MKQFEIGDKVKTTPQWERMPNNRPRNGVVVKIERNIVVFEVPNNGGKEVMSADWLMVDNES